MRYLMIGILTVLGMLAIPAAAERRGQTYPVAGTGRVETQAQCEARQQRIRDPASGIRIQAGDAARFCNRQRSRR
jgi:hypothetical protein